MANNEHLATLKEGVDTWNAWRSMNEEECPDFSDADLSRVNLFSADLSNANLFRANLSHTNLSSADLSHANLSNADLSSANLFSANLSHANLSNANLSNANLSNANLSNADLFSADLRSANLRSTNLSNADLSSADLFIAILIGANLGNANLRNANFSSATLRSANFRGANLSSTTLSNTDLSHADLRDATLSHADLSHATLNHTDLSHANLSGVLLIAAQLLRSNLTAVTLTGACIQDWHINNETRLDGVVCEYVYLKSEWSTESRKYGLSDRRPNDPDRFFAPGEFITLFQPALETIDLLFTDGIVWNAFFQSFQALRSQYGDTLSIQAIEKKSHGAFVIRLEVPPNTDTVVVKQQAKDLYERDRQQLEAQYRERLRSQDQEIEIYKQQSADMLEIVKFQASRPIIMEANFPHLLPLSNQPLQA